MGLLVDGVWHDRWYDTNRSGGRFEREGARFRHQISDTADNGFPPARNRYHLYVSYACPWAHRTLIARALKGLEDVISVLVVEPLMLERGWELAPGADPVNGARTLYEIYLKADPRFTGRVTVPVLWDTVRHTIVNNESSEIMRLFNSAFDSVGACGPDLYPQALRAQIDEVNAVVYRDINNGVYRAGFATTQAAYDEAYDALFATLDTIERRLSGQRFLVGDQITEADWRLFTTLIRFDAVYYGHFKCNRQRLVDYPLLWGYVRELYDVPKVAATIHFDHIKTHYYGSHRTINPTGIVPKGPEIDFSLRRAAESQP
jgi:putative glutathione S-transferase